MTAFSVGLEPQLICRNHLCHHICQFSGGALHRRRQPQVQRLGIAGDRDGSKTSSSSNGAPSNGNRGSTRRKASSTGDERKLGKGDGADDSSKADWSDWQDWDDDWDDWGNATPLGGLEDAARIKRLSKKRRQAEARDEYLRPIIDVQGVFNRLNLNSDETEQFIKEDFEVNQYESREALKIGGTLIIVPLLVGYIVSVICAEPFFEVVQHYNSEAFALTDKQKVEGAHEVHKHQMRVRMDATLGRAPELAGEELVLEMRHEAKHVAAELKEKNRRAMLNLLSDGAAGTTLFAMLLVDGERRSILFRTLGRIFSGFSDTAKAFLIIASTDILLGYHSEEGWTAFLGLLTQHYGYEAEESSIYTFVAIVPVTMDAIFKYWIFIGLNKKDPAAAVTLKTMDRH